MADEPESPEHGDDGDVEIDVESFEPSKQSSNVIRRNKGQWTDKEIKVFEKGLELFGHKWTKIADLLETRTAAQVKSFSKKFLKQKEIDETESLILISALTSSKVHLKMDETNEELNVDDSLPSTNDISSSKDDTSSIIQVGSDNAASETNNGECKKHFQTDPEVKQEPVKDRFPSNTKTIQNSLTSIVQPRTFASVEHIRLKRTTNTDANERTDKQNDVAETNCTDSSKREVHVISGAIKNVSEKDSSSAKPFTVCKNDTNNEAVGNDEGNGNCCDNSKRKTGVSAGNCADRIITIDSDNATATVVQCENRASECVNSTCKDTIFKAVDRNDIATVKCETLNSQDSHLKWSVEPCEPDPSKKGSESTKELDGACTCGAVKENLCNDDNSKQLAYSEDIDEGLIDDSKDARESKMEPSDTQECVEEGPMVTKALDDVLLEQFVESSEHKTDLNISEEPANSSNVWKDESGNGTLDSSASDIIPEDEATKICDALLETLSPMVVDSEPEDRFFVSIKLEKLAKKIYRKRTCRQLRYSTRKLSYIDKGKTENSSVIVDHKKEDITEQETALDRNKIELLEEHSSKVNKGKKVNKYRTLPKRTTRHSKVSDESDVPEKLIVSISLENIDSYCEEEEDDKPACVLSTHTYSEGWMIQEEVFETKGKKTFRVDDIFVDKEAFGVIKYKTLGDDGEIKEKLEILATKTAPANYIWPSESGMEGNEGARAMANALKLQKDNADIIQDVAVKCEKLELLNTDKNKLSTDIHMHNEVDEIARENKDSLVDALMSAPIVSKFFDEELEDQKEPSEETSKESLKETELQPKVKAQNDVSESRPDVSSRRVRLRRRKGEVDINKDIVEKPSVELRITRKRASKSTAVAVECKDVLQSTKPAADSLEDTNSKKLSNCSSIDSVNVGTVVSTNSKVVETEKDWDVKEDKPNCDENMNDTSSKIDTVEGASLLDANNVINGKETLPGDNIDVHTSEDSIEELNEMNNDRSTKEAVPDNVEDKQAKENTLEVPSGSNNASDVKEDKSDVAKSGNTDEVPISDVQNLEQQNGKGAVKKDVAKRTKTRRRKTDAANAEHLNVNRKVLRPRRGAAQLVNDRSAVELKDSKADEDAKAHEQKVVITADTTGKRNDAAAEKEASVEKSEGPTGEASVVEAFGGVATVKKEEVDEDMLECEKKENDASTEEDASNKVVSEIEFAKSSELNDIGGQDEKIKAELQPEIDNHAAEAQQLLGDSKEAFLEKDSGIGEQSIESIINDTEAKDKVDAEQGSLQGVKSDEKTKENANASALELKSAGIEKDVNLDTFDDSSVSSFHEDLELNGEHRPSVNTAIMSPIATSLNNELFGMNSCDLEFTLPGMSKDVLVRNNSLQGNEVKSNEIEDCLRLPPADDCSIGDELNEIRQGEDLAGENARLSRVLQCRQSLVPGDIRLDCLSPYGDTSKFLTLHHDEGHNGDPDFESNRISKFERNFQEKDAFFSDNNAGSPFRVSETDGNFKSANSTGDKWNEAIYENDSESDNACLIESSQITELRDDPFMNGNEMGSGCNPEENLLPDVENFPENDLSDAQSHQSNEDQYDLPGSQFENVQLRAESFECTEELTELPPEEMSYTKETSEGYSSGSSSDDDDDEDEDSDSSETDTDSSSSSSSRSEDEDDDDTEEESESSESESDVNEGLKDDQLFAEDVEDAKSEASSLHEENDKNTLVPLKIEEVVFEEGEILPIERKECREFFMGKLSKTPEKYLNIRKYIIKEWSKIRPAYLTKNSIRSKVDPTDANAVGRVFMFLENYGAINVGCSIKNKWVERMERRRVKYFNAKRVENLAMPTGEQKRKRGRPPQKEGKLPKIVNHVQAEEEIFMDFNVITESERNANPQFFSGNKNKSPEKYLKMRNSIINCWLDSKPAYLTKQAARTAMSWYCGDVNAVSRVHDYLEQIGAINFGCAQEPRRGRPSRARMNQERLKSLRKDKEFRRDKDKSKDRMTDSKVARMKIAQKELENITREVELELSKPGPHSGELIGLESYERSMKRSMDDIPKMNERDSLKPKSKRGRKPKIRQCEPDSTVQDENLIHDKDLVRAPKNCLIPVKDLISDRESGPASDKSSIGDSGFDSVAEISPLLESDMVSIGMKVNGLTQDTNNTHLEDESEEQTYPLPTEERTLDIGVITEEEKLGCPEFFVGSKVKPPEKYVKIRDSILKSWHNKKPFYLNKHNARCDMPWYTGDINSIGRVHAYLERVGAINYGAVQRPKRSGRMPVCRKRKHADSPRYEIPSPETEDEDAVTEKLLNDDMFNNDLITEDEREAFKRFLTEGNGMDSSPSNYSKVRHLISDMWAKCKQKYLAKSEIDTRYADDCDETNSDTGDDSYIEDRTIMNGTYPEGGKNGVWEMTKTFSLGLRPRKRWKMDINQDWIDRTESEGYTIKHLSPDEVESRARPLSFANKLKKSLPESDPYKLVPCRTFPSENAQPFTVTICLKALLVMDFHSHLSSSEVIGLVGGKYYHSSRRLEIMRVAPCSNVGTNLQCEMDPVSQAKASSDLAQHGLDVVGWYHSHPTFAPTPSLRDIDTQSTFQEWFSRAGAPFVGIIISPYNMSNNEVPHKSQITCLTISDQWDESKSYRIPYMFKFKTEDLDRSDSFDDTREQLEQTMQTVEGCKKYLCQARLGNTPPGLLLLKSFEAKLNRKTSKKDEVLSQVRNLIGI